MKNKFGMILILLPVVFLLLLAANPPDREEHHQKKVISLTDKPLDLPFSPAIFIEHTLYISGQLATEPATGKFLGGTMTEQAERIIKNMEILLKKVGMDLSHVVKTTVYISDFDEFQEFNTVFRKMFPQNPPTRATVQVARLARDAKIEISAVAVK